MKHLIAAALMLSLAGSNNSVLADSGMEVCNDFGKVCADLATREFVEPLIGEVPVNIVRINGRVIAGAGAVYEMRWQINCDNSTIQALKFRQIPLDGSKKGQWQQPEDSSASYLEPSDPIVDNACADPD